MKIFDRGGAGKRSFMRHTRHAAMVLAGASAGLLAMAAPSLAQSTDKLGTDKLGTDTQGNDTQDDNTSVYDFDHVSCTGAPFEIRVVINKVKDPIGLMTTDLYNNDPDNFLKVEGRALQKQVAAKAPTTHFCLHAPAAGDYAIAIYHDENANGLFDKGAFGLPAEPWGLSRDPRVGFRPPAIEKSLFSVTQKGAQISIRLRTR